MESRVQSPESSPGIILCRLKGYSYIQISLSVNVSMSAVRIQSDHLSPSNITHPDILTRD